MYMLLTCDSLTTDLSEQAKIREEPIGYDRMAEASCTASLLRSLDMGAFKSAFGACHCLIINQWQILHESLI